ncbi:MAG: type IV pilin [Haloferacaceae archaeon]
MRGRRATVRSPVALAVAVTVALAVGGVALGALPADRPTAAVAVVVDPGTDRLTLTHRGGDPLDVRRLRLRVRVGGRPLRRQPPVPFFAARGFRSGPTGPFNVRADPRWRPGERASLRLAATNDPLVDPGDRVTVTVLVDGWTVARVAVSA